MSIFSKIGKVLKGGVKGFLGGGIPGAIGGAIGGLSSSRPSSFAPITVARALPTIIGGGVRTLPGAGTFSLPSAGTIGRAVGTAATAKVLFDQFGRPVTPRKRRRKGITASELKGFKRVACVLRDYQKVATKCHVKTPAKRSRAVC